MFIQFLNNILDKIKALDNKTLLILGSILLLLIILFAYFKKSRRENIPKHYTIISENEDCFNGSCKMPSNVQEVLTKDEHVPLPDEPVIMDIKQSQEQTQVLEELPSQEQTQVLEELQSQEQTQVLEELQSQEQTQVLEELVE
jgi:hypothetical protein